METKLERRIDSIRLQNLLSFRDTTLELRNLNVVIGPNGSGKSNLLTALEILRGTRGNFRDVIRRTGGVDLRWRGVQADGACVIGVVAAYDGSADLRFRAKFEPEGGWVREESLGYVFDADPDVLVMRRKSNRAYLADEETLRRDRRPDYEAVEVNPKESTFAEVRDVSRHTTFTVFADGVESIRIARPSDVGPAMPARSAQSVHEDETRLLADGSNLALLLNNLISSGLHEKIDDYISRFLPSYKRLTCRIEGGAVRMFLAEHGLKEPIPASRFSDGTIAFLRLIALLHEPAIPMILAIEEPEAGLHPDAVRLVAEMIRDASANKQILITTHSPELVDALSDDPESVIVCEKDPEDGTQFRRLSANDLDEWLERYTLGELWKKGEIGGTRW